MNPIHTYLTGPDPLRGITCTGPVRQLTLAGRSGIQPSSIHTRLRLDHHTINADQGCATLWVLPLESLSSTASIQHIHLHDPGCDTYTLISDQENPRKWTEATFNWTWASHWYPQWWAQFFKGGIYPEAYQPVSRAFVGAGHFNFHAMRWYQLGLTWDKPANQYRLYANGVLIATSNRFAASLEHQPCGESLYIGEPAFAFGELAFYDTCPGKEGMSGLYATQGGPVDNEIQRELLRTFAGAEPRAFRWEPDDAWTPRMNEPLNTPGALDHFHVQGYTQAPSVTAEGILVETRLDVPKPDEEDLHQVYLWTKQSFEGDFALEFEFKPTLPNGLSLLMLQANGMHGEDFMADYPLRTTGSMKMVYGEAVRNYHWEFFRGMDDTRNDVASNALLKQPWNQPLAYHCATAPLELHRWHRLQFVQEGGRLRGAINGVVVFDVNDAAGSFTGSHYTHGHLAIRCMTKTRNFYRNIRIWTRPVCPDLQVSDLPSPCA